jgi:hypothetical protein
MAGDACHGKTCLLAVYVLPWKSMSETDGTRCTAKHFDASNFERFLGYVEVIVSNGRPKIIGM